MTAEEGNYLQAAMRRLEKLDRKNGRPSVSMPLHEAMDFIDAALGRKEFQRSGAANGKRQRAGALHDASRGPEL